VGGQVLPRVGLPENSMEVAAVASRYAVAADTNRALAAEVMEALVAAGFCRHFVPLRWGGPAGRFSDLLPAVALVGQACASAAWCGSLMAGAARMGAFLPEAGQRELWASGPDVLVVAGINPSGEVTEVAGGWRLTGAWEYTSGVDFADWALVCGPVSSPEEVRFFLLPRADFRIEDTWCATGMRGTGSNTLVVNRAVVPRHRSFRRSELLAGRSTGTTARCHSVPLRVASGLLFAAPALGAARGAAGAFATTRAGPAANRSPSTLQTLARATADVDAAWLLLRRAAETADRDDISPTEVLRNPMDCALAVDLIVGAVERLFLASGTRGQLAGEPLARCWRDVHTIAGHVALRIESAATAYGEHLFDGSGG
jgi:two-component flavin-dependent monooxygenase